jgi:hypothetical protein
MSAEKLPPDPFTRDEIGYQDLLLEQAGAIRELSEEVDGYALKSLRYEEGVCALQWQLSRAPMEAPVVSRCLGELVAFAETGREPGFVRAARAEMGH